MERLTFTATGTYDRAIPLDLVQGLVQEMQQHMEAYGFKEVQLTTQQKDVA